MKTDDSIKVFQDVSFTFPLTNVNDLRQELKKNVHSPWSWDAEGEKELNRGMSENDEVIWFHREPLDEGGSSSFVTLFGSNIQDWKIPNVVPRDIGDEISIFQYNEVLNDFVISALKPSLESLDIKFTMTPRNQSIEYILTDASATALRRFLAIGNPGAGALHPNDEERSCEFICRLHRDNPRVDTSSLKRWLEEVQHRSEQDSNDLVRRIDGGLALLHYREVSFGSR